MGRTKVKVECRLKSWGEVDDTLQRLAECERIRDNLTNEMNAELAAVKKRYSDSAIPVQEHIDHYGDDICQFVTEHRDELEGKTKELNFGSTGFRISSKLKYRRGVKIADVIAALLRLKLKECVKITQKPIVEAIKKLPVDVLDEIGAYLEKTDGFWYDTKREEIQPVAEREVQP